VVGIDSSSPSAGVSGSEGELVGAVSTSVGDGRFEAETDDPEAGAEVLEPPDPEDGAEAPPPE
jgi:hypothetical protein